MVDNETPKEKLSIYKDRLEGAMESGNLAWWEMELPSGKIKFNDQKAEMLGYSPEDFTHYSDFTDLIHPEDYDQAMKAMRNHLEGEKDKYETEYRIKKKNGDYKWFRDIGGITKEEGENKKVTGVVIDIDEQKKSEEELSKSEERYRRFFETAQDGMLILDAESGKIKDANPYIQELTGYSKKELIGNHLWEIGTFENVTENRERFEELVDEGYIRYEDLPLKTKDGEKAPVEFVSNTYEAGGEKVVQCNVRDISEKKEAQEALEYLLKSLSEVSGQDLFDSLVEELIEFLDVDGALVGKIKDDGDTVSSISMMLDGEWVEEYEYTLTGTPCENITEDGSELYRKNITDKFPEDEELKELEAEGYLGTPIHDENKNPIGIIWAVSKDEIKEVPPNWRELMRIVSARASTEIKKLEIGEKFRNSINRFRKFFENLGDSVFISEFGGNNHGDIIDVNSRAVEKTGYSKDELLQMNIVDDIAINGSIEDSTLEEYDNKVKNGEMVRFTEKKRSKDGSEYWSEVSLVPIENESGMVVITVSRDISERKEMERKLEESKERYQEQSNFLNKVFDSIPYPFLVINTNDYTIEKSNLSDDEEWEKQIPKCYEITHNRDLPCHIGGISCPIIKIFDEQGSAVKMEHEHYKNGEKRYYEVHGYPIRDESGEINRIIEYSIDITERKKIEQKLRKSQRRLKRTQKIADVGSWEINLDTDEIEWSEETYQIFGVPKGESVDFEQFLSYIHPEDREFVQEKWEEALETGEYDIEHRIIVNDETKWVHEKAVIDRDEEPRKVIGSVQDITNQKEMEKGLQNSVERYRKIINSSPDPIILANAETGMIIDANNAAEELLKMDRRDIIGMNQVELHPKEETEKYKKMFKKDINGEEELDLSSRGLKEGDLYVVNSDGEKIPVEISSTTIELEGRRIAYGTFRDITQRKEAEEELRKLSKTVEQSPSVIAITDKEGDLEYVNPQFEEITGYKKEEVIGKNPRILKSGEQPQEFYEELWNTITSGNTWKGNFKNEKKNGDHYWEAASIAPITNEKNQITHYVKVAEDITEMKKAQKELERSEEKYRSLVESTIVGIERSNLKNDKITFINDTLANKLDYDKIELIGKPFKDLIPEEEIEKFESKYKQVSSGQNRVFETKLNKKNGTPINVLISGSPYRNNEGDIVGVTRVIIDITERKNMRKKISVAKKQLKRRQELIDRLGHDLKTPATPLNNLIPIVKDEVEDPELEDMLGVCEKNARHIKDIIQNILKMAEYRVSSDDLFKKIDLTELINNFIYDFRERHDHELEEKSINLINKVGIEELNIRGDKQSLVEVLDNLASNAVENMPEGGKIIFDLEEGEDDVTISVRDTGRGMTEEQIDQVFEEFYKADKSRHDRTSKGLGLTISKRVIEMHGGKIWADSPGLGEGSTFYFQIPK